jgi:preprotein translocase subunit SecG
MKKKNVITGMLIVLAMVGTILLVNASSMDLTAAWGRKGTVFFEEDGPGNYVASCKWDGGNGCYEVIVQPRL